MKLKKKAGGMTLVEVIVSLAVFTILASFLVTACVFVCKNMERTNGISKKVNYQAPVAENFLTSGSQVNNTGTGKIEIFDKSSGTLYGEIEMNQYAVAQGSYEKYSGQFRYFSFSGNVNP